MYSKNRIIGVVLIAAGAFLAAWYYNYIYTYDDGIYYIANVIVPEHIADNWYVMLLWLFVLHISAIAVGVINTAYIKKKKYNTALWNGQLVISVLGTIFCLIFIIAGSLSYYRWSIITDYIIAAPVNIIMIIYLMYQKKHHKG
ncbi:MAG: hypothetical protein VB031_05715 [Eubacteriaceae bacterium]|nr:hypothetical protein [Eubacteriaceae bacterium]